MLIPVNGITLEHFTWIQLIGFIVLLLGILVFNEIIILPYLGIKHIHADT